MDDYIKAGELYGELMKALGFGELSMWEDRYGFAYHWVFKASDGNWAARHTVTKEVLRFTGVPTACLAQEIAGDWKREARRQIAERKST